MSLIFFKRMFFNNKIITVEEKTIIIISNYKICKKKIDF